MTISYTVDRAALSLADLVIGNNPADGLWVPEDGVGTPGRTWRRAYASAPWVHGSVQTSAALEQSSLPLSVYAQGASQAALDTLKGTLVDAFSQFVFDLTVTENGSGTTWLCDCADISWNEFDSGMSRVYLGRATLTIPCYPVGA